MFGKKRKTTSEILSNSPKCVAQLLAAPMNHRAICILSPRCSAETVSGPRVHFLLKTSQITSISSALWVQPFQHPRVTAGPNRLRPNPAEGAILQCGRDAGMGFALGRSAQRHAQPQEKPLPPVQVPQGAAARPPGLGDTAHLCKMSWRHCCP